LGVLRSVRHPTRSSLPSRQANILKTLPAADDVPCRRDTAAVDDTEATRMKSTPLIINWHDQNAPVYSAHFEPHGKGRLATAGGDNNVRVGSPECLSASSVQALGDSG
jgi:hypothetical protein